MKRILFALIIPFSLSAQQQESSMRPSLWLGIWDNVKNVSSHNINAVGYNDIPRELTYKGILVEVLEFDDANGHNLVILTQTGMFPVSKKNDAGQYEKQNDRAEIFAYCYVRADEKTPYRQLWRMSDAQDCEGLDLYAGFTKKSLSITDLDADGVAEVSFQYTKSCRSDVSPADRYAMIYESNERYLFKGITQVEGMPIEAPMIDKRAEGNPLFRAHLEKIWSTFAEDRFEQFAH
jgi:hypothetical protein